MWNVIKRPLVTEKNTLHGEASTYVFEVDSRADKTAVKGAVEKAFNVKVVGVRTMNSRGRRRRVGARGVSAVPRYKKALVKLAKGDKIALFEGV